MASTFASIRQKLTQIQKQEKLFRNLHPRERRLVAYLKNNGMATAKQIAEHLNLSPRTVTALCRNWVDAGILRFHDASKKDRSFCLKLQVNILTGSVEPSL